jgi:DNA-binding XRE family transcriptional regulator
MIATPDRVLQLRPKSERSCPKRQLSLMPAFNNEMLEIKLARKPSFSSYIRDARIKRSLSVADVAEQVGVSTVSIYLWELGRTKPRADNLSALCKVLKLPIRATRAMAIR